MPAPTPQAEPEPTLAEIAQHFRRLAAEHSDTRGIISAEAKAWHQTKAAWHEASARRIEALVEAPAVPPDDLEHARRIFYSWKYAPPRVSDLIEMAHEDMTDWLWKNGDVLFGVRWNKPPATWEGALPPAEGESEK